MINGRTCLHVVANGTMTGRRYIDEVLLPHVRLFRGAVGDKFVFMDDNATCHRTLAVQDFLDSEGIQRLVWPTQSPDLNPIENVWDALGRQAAGRNYPPTNKNTLIRALTEEWDKLPQQLLDNVVQSMLYHDRKSDEMEIRKSSSDNNSSSYKWNNFEGRQPGSNESQYSRKNGSGERRELEEKRTEVSYKKDQGERHTSIASNCRPFVRSSPGSWTEPNRRTKNVERDLKDHDNLDLEHQRGSPMRREHNKKDQFDPEEAGRNNSTDPTLRSKEGQAAGIPEVEVVNNTNARRGKEEFVEWAQNEITVVPDLHKRILFSDEAHFWLNGYVNKQNCRIWSEANPQVFVETPLHPEKLTVWCALSAGGIIGPYFFENDEGHNVTVNGDRYRVMITNFFIPELNNHDVQELWFQQDGATCHTARATIDLLKDIFGKRPISRFGPVNWPPRSCYLTPLDYFLWGYVKSLVYSDKP
ncbi:transposase [Trichonephila clavipes]|nr:transposase [Trichonephila clavipes]